MSKETGNIYYKQNDDKALNRFKGMSPEKKLELSLQLYYSTRELKRAAVKHFHPDWNDLRIEEEVRNSFLYARS